MAKSLLTILTHRKTAHLLIARLQSLLSHDQGWKDAPAVWKACKWSKREM